MAAPVATMKAVVYDKPFEVAVRQVERPQILHPDDIIRVGSGVTLLKAGDRVVMPFNVACGRCLNCEEGRSAFCTHVNPGFAGGAYGYVAMGPYPGGQAEYVRVPFADFNALLLPPGTAHEEDFALLADIFPTASKPPFSRLDGPVGLMAAYSAVLRGASDVYVVDRVAERLSKAKDIGCIPIDFSKADAVDQILKLRGGKEVDRGVDAVGYQATSGDGKTEQPNAVLEALIRVVRPTGGLGIPGLYVPSDPGAPDSAAAKGYISFPFGKLFEKGLTLGTGQCNVKTYNRYLRDLIISGRAKPSFVVSHNLPLSEAPSAYHKFDKRIDGYTKVLLHPSFVYLIVSPVLMIPKPKRLINDQVESIVGVIRRAFKGDITLSSMTGRNVNLEALLLRSMVRAAALEGTIYVVTDVYNTILRDRIDADPIRLIRFVSEAQRALGWDEFFQKISEEARDWWTTQIFRKHREALNDHLGAHASADGKIVALATQTESNAVWYTGLNFKVIDKIELEAPAGNFPDFILMWEKRLGFYRPRQYLGAASPSPITFNEALEYMIALWTGMLQEQANAGIG
ncbi:hypothetical protein EYR40_006181 [Pleurotus pulmonarius]|nr:hypothetical protein EYR40_006181 [Pleurotus pulmonarius]